MATKDILYERLVEANVSIANSMKGISDNLQKLNDHNILHAQATADEHKSFKDTLQVLTDKYWWMILALVGVIVAIAGYKQLLSIFIK